MNLLETLISFMGMSQIIAVCLLGLGWQYRWMVSSEEMMRGIESRFTVWYQMQELVDGLRPLLCPFPNSPVLELTPGHLKYYQFVADAAVSSHACGLHEKVLYWHEGRMQLSACGLAPETASLVYYVMPRELSWRKTATGYAISLKQSGASPQVLVHGFSDFSITLNPNHQLVVHLTWPHFKPIERRYSLC